MIKCDTHAQYCILFLMCRWHEDSAVEMNSGAWQTYHVLLPAKALQRENKSGNNRRPCVSAYNHFGFRTYEHFSIIYSGNNTPLAHARPSQQPKHAPISRGRGATMLHLNRKVRKMSIVTFQTRTDPQKYLPLIFVILRYSIHNILWYLLAICLKMKPSNI